MKQVTENITLGDDEKEFELCISCLEPNKPGAHFCPKCGTPLSSWSSTAPFESIFAQGDFMRKVMWGERWNWHVKVLFLLFIMASTFGGLVGLILSR